MQALLDEDDSQTQEQLAASLKVSRQAVSLRLHAMGKIQKEGKWMPHELTERNLAQRKTTAEILLERYHTIESPFCTVLLPEMRNGFISIIQRGKNHIMGESG